VGRSIVRAGLTTAADANGLALALPQVAGARGEGFERATPTIVIDGLDKLIEAIRAA